MPSTWSKRVRPVQYISLLQDILGVVQDHLGRDIYIYTDTGTPIDTERENRDVVTTTFTKRGTTSTTYTKRTPNASTYTKRSTTSTTWSKRPII